MLSFPAIDPIAFSVGPVAVHWYGLAYLVGIASGWMILARRASPSCVLTDGDQVGDLVFYAALGAVLGGRIGYVLFYNPAEYLREPMALLAVWRGGMSFHGGVIGFIVALALYARRRGHTFLDLTDFVLPVVPIGLFFGRVANFINQELWGAPSSVAWAVLFTDPAAGGVPRHPSQLYEAALEGVVLWMVLNWLWARRAPRGRISGAFLLGYGIFRSAIEFLREPDAHIGFLFGDWLTMGQLLSAPMVLAGTVLIWRARSQLRGVGPASHADLS